MKQFISCLNATTLRASIAAIGLSLTTLAGANDNPDLSRLAFVPTPITSGTQTGAGINTLDVNQQSLAEELTTSIDRYETKIRQLENQHGTYHRDIFEDSLALGNLYRRQGDHEKALKSYDRAFQTTRVNNGLFDLSQTEVLRGMIESYIALNDIEKAHEKQEYLFYIQQKNFAADSPEILPAMIEWADWNVNLYLQERSYSNTVLAFEGDPLNPNRTRTNPRIIEAQGLYYRIIETLAGRGGLDDPRLVTTERKVAALNYMMNQDFAETMARVPVSMGGSQNLYMERNDPSSSTQFYNGINALKRAIAYSYNADNPDFETIAERIMELGDWYLLFDRRVAALEIYEEAFTVLSASSLSQHEIDRIMTPGMPLQLPEMVDKMTGRMPDASEYKGYIDVEFTLNKFGMASRPNIIDASTENVKAIHRELFRTIRSCKFRPKFVEGSASSQQVVQLRYYYTY